MSAFWDETLWRDEYYERLMALPASQLTPARAAEQEYCRIERRAVDRLIRRSGYVADLGCGTGRVTFAAAEEHPDKRFVGVDISQGQLDIYGRRLSPAARARVELVHASVSEMRLTPNTVDLALFCNHTFGAILGPDRRRSLAATTAALSPGGLLLIAGFSNLDLAPACYRNWGMELVSLDPATGLIELASHYSLWEPAEAVVAELEPHGLSLCDQTDFELGYLQVFESTKKANAA